MTQRLDDALAMVARTDVGSRRQHNEDAVYTDPGLGLAILADGMGGYNAGEVASGMAITELVAALAQPSTHGDATPASDHNRLRAAVRQANLAILTAANTHPQYEGMGTTLVMLQCHDNKLTVTHLGDSRLYRLRAGELQVLTRDHSLLQEQLDSGMLTAEQARHSQNRNLVTRALGVDPEVEIEIADHAVLPGDLLLLCSDGLNDMVDDDEIALTLNTLGSNLNLCADQLVQTANDYGGRDNISVILIRVVRAFPATTGWWQKLLNWFK